MRYAIVRNGVVVNVVEYDGQPSTPPPGFPAEYAAIQSDAASPGWIFSDGGLHAPDAPADEPKVPQIISDRQFFQKLAIMGVITTDEALAAVGPGTIPAALEVMVQSLPQGDQFAARMLLTGATSFDRQHPMVQIFGAVLGWTSDQIDTFWSESYVL